MALVQEVVVETCPRSLRHDSNTLDQTEAFENTHTAKSYWRLSGFIHGVEIAPSLEIAQYVFFTPRFEYHVQGRIPTLTLHVDVCTLIEEEIHEIAIEVFRDVVQRTVTTRIARVDVLARV